MSRFIGFILRHWHYTHLIRPGITAVAFPTHLASYRISPILIWVRESRVKIRIYHWASFAPYRTLCHNFFSSDFACHLASLPDFHSSFIFLGGGLAIFSVNSCRYLHSAAVKLQVCPWVAQNQQVRSSCLASTLAWRYLHSSSVYRQPLLGLAYHTQVSCIFVGSFAGAEGLSARQFDVEWPSFGFGASATSW